MAASSTNFKRYGKTPKIVIPRAGFARGIRFFSLNAEKQIPRFAWDDN
jgi:hypothetical protein